MKIEGNPVEFDYGKNYVCIKVWNDGWSITTIELDSTDLIEMFMKTKSLWLHEN